MILFAPELPQPLGRAFGSSVAHGRAELVCGSTRRFSPRVYRAQRNIWHQPSVRFSAQQVRGNGLLAGFGNCFGCSRARRRVSLWCCAASRVSGGGCPPDLSPHGEEALDGSGCSAASRSVRLCSVLRFPSPVLVLSILLMSPSICSEHSSEHFPEGL